MPDTPAAGAVAPASVARANDAVAAAASSGAARYFPAIVCGEYDSPVDALVALKVPRDEALDLVVAAWPAWRRRPARPQLPARSASAAAQEHAAAGTVLPALLTQIDGGRHVAVLFATGGRWLACNAFPDPPCPTPAAAAARLERLLRRGRRGCIGCLA